MPYRYDVFISYRRNSFSQRWIEEEFIPEFVPRLELELGKPPQVFWDETSVNDGQISTTRVIHALRDSRCLLSLLSGPYFSSAWCSAEWQTFKQRAENAGLVAQGDTLTLPIRWHDGEQYLGLLGGYGPHTRDFRRFRLGGAWRATPIHAEFQTELNDLVETVARMASGAPEHDEGWPLVNPDALPPAQLSPGTWSFKLSPPRGDGPAQPHGEQP